MILDAPNTTVCFSISHVLAAPYNTATCEHELFVQSGVVATASKIKQFIFPGVVELMQLLFETEHVQVAFFDDAEEHKTKEFVEMLLSYALGPERYEEVRTSVRILSRNDLSSDTLEAYRHQTEHFAFKQNFRKKSVVRVRELVASTDAVLLVDRSPAYVAAGQEESFFCAPNTSTSNFVDLDTTAPGVGPIDFYFAHMGSMQDFLGHRRNIITHKYVLVGCIESKYIMFYVNEKTNEICFYPFNSEDNEYLQMLCPKDGCYSRQNTKNYSSFLATLLLSKLTQYHGKINRICRRVNHIYFIAGAIFEAMRIATIEHKPVSKVFFSWQFSETKAGYENLFEQFHANERLYYLGLERLRQKNQSLHFLSTLSHCSQDEAAELASD